MTPEGFPSAFSVGRSVLLRAFVPGIEVHGQLEVPPKDRHRSRVVSPKDRKPFVQTYDTERNRVWAEHVGATVLAQLRGVPVVGDSDFTLPITDCRVILSLRFNLRKPASYPARAAHAIHKPDLDNLTKAILDALVQAKVLDNDQCVTDEVLCKRYADKEHPVGVELEMTCLPA